MRCCIPSFLQREHDQLLTAAQEKEDEDLDEAKRMDSLMQYARTVTIRDKQREEKKLARQREKEDDKMWAQLMEEDRVRDLTQRREAERQKAIERREGAKVVVSQIAERRMQKEMEREEIEREGEQRVREMERQRLEEIELAKQRAAKNRELQEMIVQENQRFLQAKAKQRELDRLEDLKVVEYLKQKAVCIRKCHRYYLSLSLFLYFLSYIIPKLHPSTFHFFLSSFSCLPSLHTLVSTLPLPSPSASPSSSSSPSSSGTGG